MVDINTIRQVKAFARQDGALMSLLWIGSFLFSVQMPESSMGSFLALATPFFIGFRLKQFRNYALDGNISFRRGYAYVAYSFIYASLIFALAQFLYFRYLDGGTFATTIANTAQVLTPIYEQSGMSKQDIDTSLSMMMDMKPIHWAIIFMMQNIFIGFLLALPVAWAYRRNGYQQQA
ncbi:MAG: DUF4199 domain-containing protein [Prevotella sp.]|nr:DUF4199 domain-containing protein [Prevotella sp.]